MPLPLPLSGHEAMYRGAFEESGVESAILDRTGRIVAVNGAWRAFATANDGDPDGYLGWRYLDACQCDEPGMAGIRESLARVFEGHGPVFDHEYACPSPKRHRWFVLRAQGYVSDGIPMTLVTHADVTRRYIAERRADRDPLTGLLNRRAFGERLRQALSRAERGEGLGGRGAVLFVDLDAFKRVNDTAGHDVGDVVLRAVGERLRRELRTVDAVARIGGDEFVLLAEDADAAGAYRLAERVRGVVAWPVRARGGAYPLTCSVGISFFPEDGFTAARLIRAADQVMYRAKREGGEPIRSTRD
ncbi:MAG: GGDEF domain-containing protein [Halofilum sp. (in: g-proteobacteria)]